MAEYRRSFLADEVILGDLKGAIDQIHEGCHAIRAIGPDEVADIAFSIVYRHCLPIYTAWTPSARQEQRAEIWRARVAPLRVELDEAIKQAADGCY